MGLLGLIVGKCFQLRSPTPPPHFFSFIFDVAFFIEVNSEIQTDGIPLDQIHGQNLVNSLILKSDHRVGKLVSTQLYGLNYHLSTSTFIYS
jgi:hypothetical protein